MSSHDDDIVGDIERLAPLTSLSLEEVTICPNAPARRCDVTDMLMNLIVLFT